ncbi:hypothetical protein HY523_01580 [Candidatus Berkelbacteria bacterium]|nr:hypothetical protein [Candidatus Berkelbacteria bacterium]
MEDLAYFVAAIQSLPKEQALETSLCLLHSLLPFQLRLSALAEQATPTQADVALLHQEFFDYLVSLRDGLLGA